MKDRLIRTSKFLSLVLRHEPEKIGIELDAQGWRPVADLLRPLNVTLPFVVVRITGSRS